MHPEDRSKINATEKLLLSGTNYEFNFRLVQVDESYKYIVGKEEPIYKGEQVIRIVGTIQDVTEKKLRKSIKGTMLIRYRKLGDGFS